MQTTSGFFWTVTINLIQTGIFFLPANPPLPPYSYITSKPLTPRQNYTEQCAHHFHLVGTTWLTQWGNLTLLWRHIVEFVVRIQISLKIDKKRKKWYIKFNIIIPLVKIYLNLFKKIANFVKMAANTQLPWQRQCWRSYHDDFKTFPDNFWEKSVSLVLIAWTAVKVFNLFASGSGGGRAVGVLQGLNRVKSIHTW